jgi:hypothetical protein
VNISVVPLLLSVVSDPQNHNQFQFWFLSQDNQSYVVESSVDMTNWLPVLTNTPVNGRFDFIDVNVSDAQRFYRVRQ